MTTAPQKGRRPRFMAVQEQLAAHIRDPENVGAPAGIEDRRMAIYRELFFNNIRGFLENNFPVLRRLYDGPRFDALVRDFMVRHRAHTPLFPELPREFLRFVETCRGPAAGDPPFLLELAHYEWVELALSLEETELDDIEADADGDLLTGRPVRSPLAWLLSYRYPVHRIRPDYQPTQPLAEPTHLVVYRDRRHAVRFLALNAVSARLLQLLEQRPGRTGAEHLAGLAEELAGSDPAVVTEAGAGVLEEFRQRDIVLGVR